MLGETAFVVGGGGAIGSVIVARLLDCGLEVVAIGRDVERLERLCAVCPAVRPLVADIAHDDAIATIRTAAGDAPVRMLVHGPGLPVRGGTTDAEPGALAEAVNIKCGGMLRLVRAVEDNLVRGSRLLAIGGHYGFEPGSYAAGLGVANAALPNLMRQLNLAYGERGITAHLLAPGPADTDRLRKIAIKQHLFCKFALLMLAQLVTLNPPCPYSDTAVRSANPAISPWRPGSRSRRRCSGGSSSTAKPSGNADSAQAASFGAVSW